MYGKQTEKRVHFRVKFGSLQYLSFNYVKYLTVSFANTRCLKVSSLNILPASLKLYCFKISYIFMKTYLNFDSLEVIIVQEHAREWYFITEILNLKTYLLTVNETYEQFS